MLEDGLNDDLSAGAPGPLTSLSPRSRPRWCTPGQVEAPGPGAVRLPRGRGVVYRHERHPAGRDAGQPAIHLCGPVGLGKGHHARAAQHGHAQGRHAEHRHRHHLHLRPAQMEIPRLPLKFKHDVRFITSQELEDRWLDLSPKQREEKITGNTAPAVSCKSAASSSPAGSDGRAPDYDDWTMNGDILFWHETLGCAMELSSMASACPESLDVHCGVRCDYRRAFLPPGSCWGQLPTMGRYGQSRMCMLLGKAHIGGSVSYWDEATRARCKEAGIVL